MNSSTLRYLWFVIEQTQTSTLLKLNDTDLVKQLLKELDNKRTLSSDETNTMSIYLYSRIALIRDLAQARLEHRFST